MERLCEFELQLSVEIVEFGPEQGHCGINEIVLRKFSFLEMVKYF